MPLLGNGTYIDPLENDHPNPTRHEGRVPLPGRRQSQHSGVAKTAILGQFMTPTSDGARTPESEKSSKEDVPPGTRNSSKSLSASQKDASAALRSVGAALSDTPVATAPNSPIM